MSDGSERRLQSDLNERGFYTIRSPGSGTGIDNGNGERVDHPDVVAIKARTVGEDSLNVSSTASEVLVIEEKHTADLPLYIRNEQVNGLKAIADVTGGRPLIAVQVKNTHYPHDFHRVHDLTDTGKNWKVDEDTPTLTIGDVTGTG